MPVERENKSIAIGSNYEILQRDKDKSFSKSSIWVESSNFYGVPRSRSDPSSYLIIGFDTEFKTPDRPLTRDEIANGEGSYEVLSYQVFCSIHDSMQPEARSWSGICYPSKGARLSFGEILTFALWKGISTEAVTKIPSLIYLGGHFTRADVPAFSNFEELTESISSVRSTFTSIGKGVPIEYRWPDGEVAKLDVQLRDTMLLTPAASKSLAALGDLVSVPKVILDPDPAQEQFYKENMDELLREKPDLFERYALRDAEICTRYLERLLDQCEATIGERSVPVTLSSIGVSLLLKKWEADHLDKNAVLGKEVFKERYFDKKAGHFKRFSRVVQMEEPSLHNALATESYHGGRNEQFWFGPAFEDNWTDYDLSSAYPTAMALIGSPDWRSMRVSTRTSDFSGATLGVALVSFEFPKRVRFPTMPVRTENGLIFPRKGKTHCGSPEIALAKALGAKLKIHHGVIVPTDQNRPIFGDFIRDCIRERASHPKQSLEALFWKEVSNSTYGKTAQGLRTKRVYDMRDRTTKPLPESRITNAYFAAYITSFVRAVLGEVINSLPSSVCVFSCTTDGFLTNATSDEIARASVGPLAAMYKSSRERLSGQPSMLEVKHQVRRPLGWRTRGQATLVAGQPEGDAVPCIVLAKGGIFTDKALDTTALQNAHIVDLFYNRRPTDQIRMIGMTGIRDIIERKADLVGKVWLKKLNMEFDWKRKPLAAWSDESTGHVAFATEAWDSIQDFNAMREYWEAFAIEAPRCLKNLEDYREFAVYVMSQSALGSDARYLRKSRPDINRLRQSLCAAWRQSCAGLDKKAVAKSASKFAELLADVGIPCKRTDVENARGLFVPNNCPPTPDNLAALRSLKKMVPTLRVDQLLSKERGIDLISASGRPNPFGAKI